MIFAPYSSCFWWKQRFYTIRYHIAKFIFPEGPQRQGELADGWRKCGEQLYKLMNEGSRSAK